MTKDVTERREAEQALRKSEERYRAVVEQTADAIFLIDGTTRRIVEGNARFHELLGYAPEELHGMSMYDLVPHDRDGVDANIWHVLEHKSYYIGERSYRHKNGQLVKVEVSASSVDHDGGGLLCCQIRQ